MDKNELKTLKEKTKIILATLDNLEKETKDYQKNNVDIVAAMTNLVNISGEVSMASKELLNAATLFSSSNFSKTMKEINKQIDKVNETEAILANQLKILENITENVQTEYKNLSNEDKVINKSIHDFHEMQTAVNTNQLKVLENITEDVHTRYNNLSNEIKVINKSIHDFHEMQTEINTNQLNDLKNITEDVETKYNNLSAEIKLVNKSINEFHEMKQIVNKTKQTLEIIATKIDRIDRNTQKGFGKERG